MTHYEIPGSVDINRGLVGYWKLDDAKNGSSVAIDRANFADGIITDGANAAGVNGLNPDALDFNGASTKVVSSSLVSSTEGSCCIRFKKDDTVATANAVVSFDKNFFMIDFALSKIRFIYHSGTWRVAETTDITQGKWTDCAITWKENDKIKIYIDGVLKDEAAITTYTGGALVGTTFGNEGGANFFLGQMQSARTYNRVITDGEISKIARLKL